MLTEFSDIPRNLEASTPAYKYSAPYPHPISPPNPGHRNSDDTSAREKKDYKLPFRDWAVSGNSRVSRPGPSARPPSSAFWEPLFAKKWRLFLKKKLRGTTTVAAGPLQSRTNAIIRSTFRRDPRLRAPGRRPPARSPPAAALIAVAAAVPAATARGGGRHRII